MILQKTLLTIFATSCLVAAEQDIPKSWTTWIKRAAEQHRENKLAEAAESGKQALSVARAFGPTDIRVAATHYMLGSIYHDAGRCGEARANYERAVDIFEKRPHPEPRYIFNAVVALVIQASECDDLKSAEKLYRKYAAQLERYRTRPGDDAKLLSVQASIFRAKKRYAEAEDCLRRAIQILEGTPGTQPVEISQLRSSLAVMMSSQGRHEEALTQSRRAVEGLESVSPRYISLPAALNNQACILVQLGRREEASKVYLHALDLARQVYGEDSRSTAMIMLNYASLLRENNESASDVMREKGAETYRRSLFNDRQIVDVRELAKSH